MLGKLSGWNDTIVALATPPGIGAIGVIRVSGSDAIEKVNDLFPSKNLLLQPSHTLHVGLMKERSTVLDQVVVMLYKAPSSYTGENVVEISAHGSPYVQEKIIRALISNGLRLAKPGEFTQRAFLNGKMDLTQAEAVADLIVSNTEASRISALQNIRGGFSSVLEDLRDQILTFSALIELELDFSQEDVEFADRSKLYDLIDHAQKVTDDLLSAFYLGNVIKSGVKVAIIGKPNAGKSTLLNTLLNEQRAIVSDIPGTTRDTIEEGLNIDGILFKLIDTAGLRQVSDDIIENIGVERSVEKMMTSDVVIYLFDINDFQFESIFEFIQQMKAINKKFLIAGNKIDLSNGTYEPGILNGIEDILFISARDHTFIDSLKRRLVDLVVGGAVNVENTIVTNARHFEALKRVSHSLGDIKKGLDEGIPGDLLSLDIRTCLHYLGEITGEITNEDQLDYIFSKFCIGK